MAAKSNYVIVYKNSSQVYAASTITSALKDNPPKGSKAEDKVILFMTYMPDDETLCVYPLTDEQIEEGKQKILAEEESTKAKAKAKEEIKENNE